MAADNFKIELSIFIKSSNLSLRSFNLNNFSDNILKFSILIPDQEPENQIKENYLPELSIEKLSNSEKPATV